MSYTSDCSAISRTSIQENMGASPRRNHPSSQNLAPTHTSGLIPSLSSTNVIGSQPARVENCNSGVKQSDENGCKVEDPQCDCIEA